MTETFTCPGCDEEFDHDLEDGTILFNGRWEETVFSQWKEENYCAGCEEDDRNPWTATIVRFGDDELGDEWALHVGRFFLECGDGDDAPPDWFIETFGEDGPKWTGRGYRGFFELNPLVEGKLHKITDGWVTGWPDDTVAYAYKSSTQDVYEALRNGNYPSVPVTWVFCLTSNVFSTATDVYVDKEEDVAAFNEWLATLSIEPDTFDRAFS